MKEIAIVGAGPVGLFLALRLVGLGIRPLVFERRTRRHEESRAIGIHPPSLAELDGIGLARPLVHRGVKVARGLAFGGRQLLGELRFDRLPGPFPFVLSVDQETTEALLAEALDRRAPGVVHRGVEVTDLAPGPDGVRLELRGNEGTGERTVSYVVACDGVHSPCREAAGIGTRGRAYRAEFAMADGADTTPFGDAAAVFMTPDGLVESFPLPGRRRRWVARKQGDEPRSADALARVVRERTGLDVPASALGEVFEFTPERQLANRLASDRVILAGDAAHVVSPIGGQGMNLGWLGAARIAIGLQQALIGPEQRGARLLALDARRRRRIAQRAALRAELNMWLGRTHHRAFRNRLVRWLLSSPLRGRLARFFTMGGLT